MATARRFRPDDDWMATRISTRPSPPKEPRDERVRIARPLGNNGETRRPTPLNVRLAQAKGSVKLVRGNGETLRDPEIVDLAATAPRTWTSRRDGCPSYPPPPPPSSNRMPRGPPSVASTRQSEMSFGILDYYIHDESPSPSPALPVHATRKVDSAIDQFDFGLEQGQGQSGDAKSGAEDEMQLIPVSPRPFDEDKPELPAKTKYSLFPAVKEVTPSANRLAQVINDSPVESHQPDETTPHRQPASAWRPRLLSGAKLANTPTNTRQRADTVLSSSSQQRTSPTPQTTIPSPSYHPRNPSLSFSNTSRLPSASMSSGSTTTTSSRRIPLRILSSSSTATKSTMNTTSRSSISTSPGSTIAGQQKPLLSRWSEDTALASPTTAAAVLGYRTSAGSLMRGEEYPACFFEDDDEEEQVMLRRKRVGSGRGWRRWFCCGGKG